MSRKSAPPQVPKVPGVDLDYRPRDYFWAVDLSLALPSDVAGEARRQLVKTLIEAGPPIPDGLDTSVLDDAMRAAWGRIHPSHMGGEYLPPLAESEVEIARISLESVTADQISIRARRVGQRIGYCVVDEYPGDLPYVCHPETSTNPLSLRELVALIEAANDGGSVIFPMLAMNARGASSPAELATFVAVTSDFYAELESCYRALTDGWLEKRFREKTDEG